MTSAAGTTRGLWEELKESIEEQIALVFGEGDGYYYVPLASGRYLPTYHLVVSITNLPDTDPYHVFALITEDRAKEIISGTDGEARRKVHELLKLHKTGRSDSDQAQELRDYFFPPIQAHPEYKLRHNRIPRRIKAD